MATACATQKSETDIKISQVIYQGVSQDVRRVRKAIKNQSLLVDTFDLLAYHIYESLS